MPTTQLDPRIGILVRKGVTVYYTFLGIDRVYVEHTDLDNITEWLALEDREDAK